MVLLFKNRANGFMSVFFQDRIFSFYMPQVYQGPAKHASFSRISGVRNRCRQTSVQQGELDEDRRLAYN